MPDGKSQFSIGAHRRAQDCRPPPPFTLLPRAASSSSTFFSFPLENGWMVNDQPISSLPLYIYKLSLQLIVSLLRCSRLVVAYRWLNIKCGQSCVLQILKAWKWRCWPVTLQLRFIMGIYVYAEIDAGLHTADFNYISVINFRICNSYGSCTTIWLWWTYGYLWLSWDIILSFVCLLWSKLACAFVIISYYQTRECVVD
jgi:hypothetical protein